MSKKRKKHKTRAPVQITPEEYRERVKFTDDFFFNRVMQDEELCRQLAEALLGVKVESVKLHETQRFLRRQKGTHGIFLDVVLEDSKRVIVFEAQMRNKGDIEKRTRYYQGVLDTATLPKGETYASLKDTYIVFICTFDPFGLGLPVYTVEKVFKEARGKKQAEGEEDDEETKYDDGANAIFYNCTAWEKCSEQQPRALMKYVDTQVAHSDLTHKIDERIKDERETQRLRSDYMTYQLRMDERYAEGIAVGEQRGIPIGYNKGITVGEKRGITIGFDRGSHERAVATAQRALTRGFAPDVVAEITGLPVDEVRALL